MEFMQSYKRLDNLCKDMNGIGVTGYIRDMEAVAYGPRYSTDWDSDYRQLKRYRHIRNQIAHDNYVTEESVCQADDSVWLEDFYQKILNRADPLAVYYRAIKDETNQRHFRNSSDFTSVSQLPSAPESRFPWRLVLGLVAAGIFALGAWTILSFL